MLGEAILWEKFLAFLLFCVFFEGQTGSLRHRSGSSVICDPEMLRWSGRGREEQSGKIIMLEKGERYDQDSSKGGRERRSVGSQA
jgi:hypothetical protein